MIGRSATDKFSCTVYYAKQFEAQGEALGLRKLCEEHGEMRTVEGVRREELVEFLKDVGRSFRHQDPYQCVGLRRFIHIPLFLFLDGQLTELEQLYTQKATVLRL